MKRHAQRWFIGKVGTDCIGVIARDELGQVFLLGFVVEAVAIPAVPGALFQASAIYSFTVGDAKVTALWAMWSRQGAATAGFLWNTAIVISLSHYPASEDVPPGPAFDAITQVSDAFNEELE